MKVQSTNFTKISLLLWECDIEHEYYDEKDADLNYMLYRIRLQYLLQQLRG